MILYYAMGGGLGHLTRALAILQKAPQLCSKTRLLSATPYIHLFKSTAPCPIDQAPEIFLNSRQKYYTFLRDYLQKHRITHIILDTFYFGIVGEWINIGQSINRILVARYLNWDNYLTRVGNVSKSLPTHSLIIEKQNSAYLNFLTKNTQTAVLNSPIVSSPSNMHEPGIDAVAVVHSGPNKERLVLKSIADNYAQTNNIHRIHEYYPEMNHYPLTDRLQKYQCIVSGAGYNSCAFAATTNAKCIVHPFQRRFDDQFLRAQQLNNISKNIQKPYGAEYAAHWILDTIGNIE